MEGEGQIRGEFFNAFNRVNFGFPGTTSGPSASFSRLEMPESSQLATRLVV
jgi:hypothetical protein